MESVFAEEEKFIKSLTNVLNLVKTTGYFVMTAIKGAIYYKVGETHFPAYNLDEKKITSLLHKNGFLLEQIEIISSGEKKGYEGIIMLLAKKIIEANPMQ